MKKIVVLFLAVALCLSFSGCIVTSDTPKKEAATAEESSGSQNEKEEQFGLNETAVFSDLKITATELKESTGTDFFVPESGNVFVGIRFTVENTSDKATSLSSLMMFEGYADDVKLSYSMNAACAFDDGTLDGELAPGKKMVGWYSMEVPQNWAEIEIDVQNDLFGNSTAKFVFTK